MKQHKFFEIDLLKHNFNYYCVKCNRCVCYGCIDEIVNITAWENGNNFTIVQQNRDLLLEKTECILSDDEYIIKNIIE